VVVFRAQRLGGGGPTTHRIIEQTDRGYITQGDNNNAPDQAGTEPPVQREQIIGQALQVRGHLVVLPGVGLIGQAGEDGSGTIQQFVEVASWRLGSDGLPSLGVTQLLFGALVFLYLGEVARERLGGPRSERPNRTRQRERSDGQDDFHTILLILTAIVVIALTAAMVIPGGAQQRGVVASQTTTPGTVDPGSTVEFSHGIGNSDVIPMTVILESGGGLTLDRRQISLSRGEIANVSLTASVPQSIGYHRFFITEHWYLPVLPTELTVALHGIHPWFPIVIINAMVALPYYLFGRWVLSGGTPVRTRSRERA
jgi:signal peptidase